MKKNTNYKKKVYIGSNLSIVDFYDSKVKNLDLLKIDTKQKIFSFNKRKKLIKVSSNFQIGNLLEFLNSKNCTIEILPGHPKITIGGCVANNVHGKLNNDKNTFKTQVASIDLKLGNKIVNLSKKKNKKLFDLTCGGYGLTGQIKAVTLKFTKQARVIYVKNKKFINLEEFIHYFLNSKKKFIYSWVNLNCKKFKAIITEGYYGVEKIESKNFKIKNYSFFRIPKINLILHHFIPLFNWIYFKYSPDSIVNQNQSHFKFFFPQYRFNLLSTILGHKDGVLITHDVIIEKKYIKSYLKELKNIFSKYYIYLTVIKKINDKKKFLNFSAQGISILISYKGNKIVNKKIYLLDQKYDAIVNLYSNPNLERYKITRYYKKEYFKFVKQIKKYINIEDIQTILSKKL